VIRLEVGMPARSLRAAGRRAGALLPSLAAAAAAGEAGEGALADTVGGQDRSRLRSTTRIAIALGPADGRDADADRRLQRA
jgi:hypothetical protein